MIVYTMPWPSLSSPLLANSFAASSWVERTVSTGLRIASPSTQGILLIDRFEIARSMAECSLRAQYARKHSMRFAGLCG